MAIAMMIATAFTATPSIHDDTAAEGCCKENGYETKQKRTHDFPLAKTQSRINSTASLAGMPLVLTNS